MIKLLFHLMQRQHMRGLYDNNKRKNTKKKRDLLRKQQIPLF
jgi:hypothetical protein